MVEEIVENNSTKTEELEEQINKLKQEATRATLLSRADTSSKIISELESRLLEGERERATLRNERDNLAQKYELLEKELRMKNINEEMIGMIKSNHNILEKNNEVLLNELENANKRNSEQQLIWEDEVEQLANTIEILKQQLNKSEFQR